MLEIIAILIGGIILGRLLCRFKTAKLFADRMNITVWLLIFSLGYSVGADHYIINHIHTLGADALVLALFAVGGSIAAVMAVRGIINHPKEKK